MAGVPIITSFTPEKGDYRTSVTITGSNFTGVTSVLFNGVAAYSVNVLSDVSILCDSPGKGGSVNPPWTDYSMGYISVTNSFGTGVSKTKWNPLKYKHPFYSTVYNNYYNVIVWQSGASIPVNAPIYNANTLIAYVPVFNPPWTITLPKPSGMEKWTDVDAFFAYAQSLSGGYIVTYNGGSYIIPPNTAASVGSGYIGCGNNDAQVVMNNYYLNSGFPLYSGGVADGYTTILSFLYIWWTGYEPMPTPPTANSIIQLTGETGLDTIAPSVTQPIDDLVKTGSYNFAGVGTWSQVKDVQIAVTGLGPGELQVRLSPDYRQDMFENIGFWEATNQYCSSDYVDDRYTADANVSVYASPYFQAQGSQFAVSLRSNSPVRPYTLSSMVLRGRQLTDFRRRTLPSDPPVFTRTLARQSLGLALSYPLYNTGSLSLGLSI
jgi:hypothetical protein